MWLLAWIINSHFVVLDGTPRHTYYNASAIPDMTEEFLTFTDGTDVMTRASQDDDYERARDDPETFIMEYLL